MNELGGHCYICGEMICRLGRWLDWLTCGRLACVREIVSGDL